MAAKSGKKKAKVFFVVGDGTSTTGVSAPGDRKVKSLWNPGRSRNKYKK